MMFRGSDVELQQLKALAVKHRYFIRDYLGVSVSEGLSAIAIAQNLLSKLGLKLTYVGRAPKGHLPRGGAFIGWGLGNFWTGCRMLSAM
jgi:hypothetical protein